MTPYLPGTQPRARHMRLDTAEILKRFHFCERAIIKTQAGWLAGIPILEAKIALSKHLWQDALTGDELRTRVFELRYPSRLLEVGTDAPFVNWVAESINAPNALAFVKALLDVYKPQFLQAYRSYLEIADAIADGPSIRFLNAAVQDKRAQLAELKPLVADLETNATAEERQAAERWVAGLLTASQQIGPLALEAPHQVAAPTPLPERQPFVFAEVPARDDRFHLCRFYWPNVIDPNFDYGEGMKLQLRSAVSHLNEVWAIESGGAVLYAFADLLDWEFILDAARWTYDESRHTKMGLDRLAQWGFSPAELPLGTYIFDSARGQEPIIRLGFLHYFETKNIGKKNDRAEEFASYHDDVSQHDMEFDWADETIHAHYGRKWLDALRSQYPDWVPERQALLQECDRLVDAVVASATDADREDIRAVANAMIEKATRLAQ
jgi:hypothetical protein